MIRRILLAGLLPLVAVGIAHGAGPQPPLGPNATFTTYCIAKAEAVT
jgi:hypothetical protein